MADISDSLLKSACSHIRRVLDNADCETSDTRTYNAMRLLRRELARMERCLPEKYRQHGTAQNKDTSATRR